ncbi:diacylglycerol O-acyltransferase [Streptacidiphilus sp. MAP12-33]|uniref:wax ester/triacylglycerol synthase domain-containing protein n=1 Tax=Streptacidiphilus sp. MAP12-33 TaxID=3156266 RepID=UPI003515E111
MTTATATATALVATATTERLSALDMAFWSLESVSAPMHLGALLRFGPGGTASTDELAALIAERAALSPRLRQRVAVPWNPLEPPHWRDDPAFDGHRHVHLHRPAPGCSLAETTAELMAAPLRRELPPWEAHVLLSSPTAGPEEGFALLLKLHHAAVDGLRAVELGVRLLDRLPRQRRPPAAEPAAVPAGPGPGAGSLGRLLRAAPTAVADVRRRLRAAGVAGDVAAAVATTGLTDVLRRTRSPLRSGPADTARRVVALPVLELAALQKVRRSHGGTLHDVVLAVLAGALRRWFLGLGHDPARRTSRVLVPVSARTRAGRTETGNQLSGYLVDLPLAEPDPLIRLLRVREAMGAHKERGADRGPGAVATLSELLPPGCHRFTGPVLRPTAPLLFDALVTDVPLPGLPFRLAGAPLTALHPLAPLAQGHTVAVAVSRYRDRVFVGLHGAADELTDPRRISGAMSAELAELVRHS